MEDNEKLVRDTWEQIIVSGENWPLRGADCCGVSLLRGTAIFRRPTWEEVWADASEFTIRRLAEIAEVKEEIEALKSEMSTWRHRYPEWDRILAREQTALAELRKGMKGTV